MTTNHEHFFGTADNTILALLKDDLGYWKSSFNTWLNENFNPSQVIGVDESIFISRWLESEYTDE